MKDKTRLLITGVAAAGALAVTVGGGMHFDFGGDGRDDRGAAGAAGADAGAQIVRAMDSLKDFDGVSVSGPDDVVVTRGSGFHVEAEGGEGLLDRLDLRVADGVLQIGRKKGIGLSSDGGGTVRVTLPALRSVTLTGPADLRVDRLEGKQVAAKLTGPGDLTIGALEAESADLAITGPGDLTVTGKAGTATLSATGPGSILASGLQTGRATLNIRGPGDISVRASESADISVSGPGQATVAGTTTCRISKSGPGEARCTG